MSYIGNSPTTTAFVTDTFSGNGSTTAFTMSVAPAATSAVLVAISGVLQDPSTYSVAGTTLTFSAAPPSGTGNISARYLGIPASGVATTAYRTLTEFTATSGQTTFSVPSYVAGFINVFRNGAMLGTADYTATNGTTVVLAVGAVAGDLIAVESFYVSSVLNAIPNTAGAVGQTNLASGVAGTGPAFSAKPASAGQSISVNVNTKITMNSEVYDTSNCYDTSTSRFTPNVAGYYQINGYIRCGASAATTQTDAAIYKNGSIFQSSNIAATGANDSGTPVSAFVYMNGTTDYLEVYFQYNTGSSPISVSTISNLGGSGTATWWYGYLVRAA